MDAGRLRYKLEIYEPKRETDSFGSEAIEYVCIRTVRAERVKLTGYRSDEVAEHFPDYVVRFNIRDTHPIGENWRIRQLGGYLYTVVAIEPNINRGYNTLFCERVNE